MHTYIYTCIHAYIHVYMHTCIHWQGAQRHILGRADGAFAVATRHGDDQALDLYYIFNGATNNHRIVSAPVCVCGVGGMCVCSIMMDDIYISLFSRSLFMIFFSPLHVPKLARSAFDRHVAILLYA